MDDDLERQLLKRLPLAQAVFHLFSHVLSESFLDDLFEENRGRCYERELSFPQMVYLIRDALLVHGGSGHQALSRARESRQLPVAMQNAYGKLARLPLSLSVAMLAEGSARLGELLPASASSAALTEVPASLRSFKVVAIDGKKLKKAAKRLKPLRGLPGKLLGGKLLVGLDLSSELAVAMSVDPDGERNDVPLVPALLSQVRAKLPGVVLWVADSQFCDLNLPTLFAAENGHFLLRYTKKLSFHPDPSRPPQEGVDSRGRRFVQEWGWVGSPKDARRRYVRRITLFRPGQRDVEIITDLLDEQAYPATDLLEMYLMRWGIERVFQQVTEVFGLEKLIGSTPKAMVFQASFCLLLYNMIQVAKAYAAQAGGVSVEEVSGEQLFYDTRQQLTAWAVTASPAFAAAYLAKPLPRLRLRDLLAQWIGGSWTMRWIKSKNKSPRKSRKHAKKSGAHTSVWRVLEAHRATRLKGLRS